MPNICINCFSASISDESCNSCGYARAEPYRDRRALPVGYFLGEKYVVGRILGAGGFGITYLALDEKLNRRVALKEFIPNGLVSRARDGITIFCNSSADEEPYRRGLQRFFREGEMIAKFDHPNIVRAYEVFEANGTAYLAMEFLEGRTLKRVMEERGRFSEEDALDVMTFVTDALKVIHQKQVVHRDLKPDNVYVTNEGRTLLLDFGGAKEIVGEHSQSMTAIFSHGYAAPEQYHGDEAKSGPWTDVYGCGALIFKLVTGDTPPSALERYTDNGPLYWGSASVREGTKQAVAQAMALKVADRIQTIDSLQDRLVAAETASLPEPRTARRSVGATVVAGVVGVSVLVVYLWSSFEPVKNQAGQAVVPKVENAKGNPLKVEGATTLTKVEVPSAPVVPAPEAETRPGATQVTTKLPDRVIKEPPSTTESAVKKIVRPPSTAVAISAKQSAEKAAKEAEAAREQEKIAAAMEQARAQRKKDDSTVAAILEEGESCFSASKFDCAISSANAALRINQQESKAISLRERSVAGQRKALEGIRFQ